MSAGRPTTAPAEAQEARLEGGVAPGASPEGGTAKRRKRAHAPRPAQLTLEAYRGMGYIAGGVEKYVAAIHKRIDLFGRTDIEAYMPLGPTTWHLQACGAGEALKHARKAFASGLCGWLLRPSRRFAIVEWRKMGKRGERKTWVGTVHEALGPESEARIEKLYDMDRHGRTLDKGQVA